MDYNAVAFQLDRCNNNHGIRCKNNYQINRFIDNLEIFKILTTESVDFKIYGKRPVFKSLKFSPSLSLSSKKKNFITRYTILAYNTIESEEQVFPILDSPFQSKFLSINRSYNLPKAKFNFSPFCEWYNLSHDRSFNHVRKVYTVFDLFGDIGGIIEVLTLVFGSLFF